MKKIIEMPFFPYIITAFFYALMLLLGLSSIAGNELGYSLVVCYILAPAIELLCGFFIGKKQIWYKWLFPMTALLNWLSAAIVFGGRFILPEFISLTIWATAPAILGLLTGAIFAKYCSRGKADKISVQSSK